MGRERHVLARAAFAWLRGDRLKPGQAVRDIVLEARLRLFAIADDINAQRFLFVDDLRHRRSSLAREHCLVERLLV